MPCFFFPEFASALVFKPNSPDGPGHCPMPKTKGILYSNPDLFLFFFGRNRLITPHRLLCAVT